MRNRIVGLFVEAAAAAVIHKTGASSFVQR